ncbi:MAG TPA: glycosyltransferase family 2 protein [Terriglobales bacterium]|nr:glycosyltransferase family 2 protein [Terriglobales bacterium]
MIRFLEISNYTLFYYYLASNLIYMLLLVTAIARNAMHQRRLASIRIDHVKDSPFTPPITILVPAHNEEATIVEAIESLLSLEYPELELVVINDGSKDGTLAELTNRFRLRRATVLYIPEVQSASVRDIYVSANEPRIVVVDKDSAGSKADAINAGLNAASSPYVCVVDADSILEPDALLRIMVAILTEPKRVVAVGGIVRVLNGSTVEKGRLAHIRLPRRPIEVLQVIEYLRAFLIGREAWGHFNMLPIISGAFGVFRRDLVQRVGGFRASAIGEDLDLVIRLHRYLREQGADYQISFVPDPACWTEVPSDIRSLARQRARWQKGLLDVLWPNRDMLFSNRYGRMGWIALPYQWVFELFAPVFELVGYFTIITAALLGVLSHDFFLQFLIFGYAFATMISIGSVLQEEITYRRYNDWRDVVRLVTFCFVEHFPYRQLQMIWRLQGLWQYMRGDVAWKPLKRVGFHEAGPAAKEKANASAAGK